VFVVSVIF